ncbi:glycoside hydrolase family 3 N-terminal domain-containing protein [Jannaschia sp. CCS1]|uniref:glycoside hydrolase family 3 N-terminal domain-containing protein n=1 Tax=Jannaschia sp. (strain CCS1) TaxID=290400 RepID=UPI00006BFFEB|nr:glycoside hydrolase family 3 N-terminal domain-containing protein [Jannaschia sp. CCS1]ABD54426.1 Beta-N-acetylhexosaminidase [Jannaschia sp. CCS1]
MATSASILGCEGLTLSASEKAFFAEARPWGFILFARNIKNAAQVLALTEELRASVGWNAPILIDQEGGRVQRLRGPIWREWSPPLDAIKAANDPSRVMYLRSYLIGHELREVGIDVQCGPTCDVARDTTHPFLKNRLYGYDADSVTRYAEAVVSGLADSGVACVVKHIPGHGLGTVDSHHDLPRVTADRATLDAIDFKVFNGMASQSMGMTAHVVFEAIDPDLPATLSPTMIDLIRSDIGFNGLLMTDDLSMNALPGTIGERAAAARAAGCDVILHCNGDRAEMEEVLANCGVLDGPAKERADIADARRPSQQHLDINAVEQELSDLLGGKVYVNDRD